MFILADISEYGDIMLNTYTDEWGRCRINGLLEDGTKILAAIGIILKQWSQTGILSHVFSRPIRSLKLSQALNALHQWTLPIPAALKQWFATLQTTHVFRRPERKMLYTQALKTSHAFRKPLMVIRIQAFLNLIHTYRRPHRLIRLLQQLGLIHAYYISKPGVKKTRLFLVIGELAFQLSED